jgi:hypothetical protein
MNSFWWCTKNAFWRAENRFLPTARIHILWYKRNFFDCLDVSKSVFHLKYDLHSCSSDLFHKLSSPVCRATYSTVVGFMLVFGWFINMVLILRTWRVEKSQLEIYRFNVSTDFSGILKMHFGKLKKPFFANRSNSNIVVYTKRLRRFRGY